jgi:hypothetical protein
MSVLYIVSESDSDALFYALCVRRLTGMEFTAVPMKNHKGDGIEAVARQLKYALRQARAAAGPENAVYFLAAIDNDRAPHPENTGINRSRLFAKEQQRSSRAEWIISIVENVLGTDRAAWPMPVALAVPVEMIESWIVRALGNAEPQPARHFSDQASESARQYYQPSAPPPQWKNLAAALQTEGKHADKTAFYEHVVKRLDPEALAEKSVSFRMFRQWFDSWPKQPVDA